VVDRSAPLKGKTNRIGLYKCYACRAPFSVKVGTIFEASHIPMHVWLQAMFLMASSKKGISSHQLHRTLGITLKSAWFLSHRIREAMDDGYVHPAGQMGDAGKSVEADETVMDRTREIYARSPMRNGESSSRVSGQRHRIDRLAECETIFYCPTRGPHEGDLIHTLAVFGAGHCRRCHIFGDCKRRTLGMEVYGFHKGMGSPI
jgi:hypothetical protein